jgi:hypothetical protein
MLKVEEKLQPLPTNKPTIMGNTKPIRKAAGLNVHVMVGGGR